MNTIEIRNELHAHPGISGAEQYAHALIVSELQPLHPTQLYANVGGYGVMAYFDKGAVATVALRADIDALPIGHRCGHDGHTAIMLQVADWVAHADLKYNVLLVFQPEEETGLGAAKMVQSGLMQRHGVRAVFGLHNLPGFPLGTVVLSRGTFAAASTGVIYSLQGRPTHASTPELGLNPGHAVALIIDHMAALSRKGDDLNDFRQSTLICCRIGQEAFGTSAGDAQVMFTLRAYTNEAMKLLLQEADNLVAEICKQEGIAFTRALREPFRATENTPQLVDQLYRIFLEKQDAEGSDVRLLQTPFRWSEDFADYLQVFPGAFFGIGSGEQQPELHHPDYDFPDALIAPAASCFETILKNIVI